MKIKIYLCIFLTILLFSCKKTKREFLKKTTIKISYNKSSSSINLNDISKNMLFSEIPKTISYNKEKTIKYANLILKDSIVILPYFKPYFLPIKTITWNENPENNNTWKLYYENLFFVSTLNHAFDNTKNITYHDKAKLYIESYIKTHSTLKDKTSKYSWYDHSCAFRTLHMLQTIFNELSLEKPNKKFIINTFNHISVNIEFMINPENYQFYNHSLMMDRSLLSLSKVFKSNQKLSNELREIASKRAFTSFNKIIDNSGLAKEHSMTYHILNHNLYKAIFDLIGVENIDTATYLKYLKMNDFLIQFVKPDLNFPLWGDSQTERITPMYIEKFGNDKRLKALLKNYKLPSVVNFENNIAVLRTNTKDNGYLAFFANYNSKIHKHHDDLSFVFQSLGIDILTDQGYYGYEKVHRPYLTSIFAHNTVILNQKDYKLGEKGQQSKITSYSKDDNFEIIQGEHNFYKYTKLKRTIYFLHPNVIIINDETFKKDKTKSLSQIYNLGEKASSVKVIKNTAIIKFPKNLTLTIKPLNKNSVLTKKKSYRSIKPYDLTPISQLNIVSTTNNITTILILDSPEYLEKVENVRVNKNFIYFTKKSEKHKVQISL